MHRRAFVEAGKTLVAVAGVLSGPSDARFATGEVRSLAPTASRVVS
jgi:hypothetical protein